MKDSVLKITTWLIRVDGVLHTVVAPTKSEARAVLKRILGHPLPRGTVLVEVGPGRTKLGA